MLPTKHGFTVAHLAFCGRAVTAIVAGLKAGGAPLVHCFEIEGRTHAKLDPYNASHQDYVWKRFFRTSKVENRDGTRRFGRRIVTDGYAVSVLLAKERALVQSSEDGPWCAELLRGAKDVRHVGVDPGGDSIVTICDRSTGKVSSYSSGRFQNAAKYRVSARRTDRWNRGTEDLIGSIVTGADMSSMEGLESWIRSYLAALRPLLAHRAEKGYRGMRFMRYVHRAKAIEKVCDMIAPKGAMTVVGFGDWAGFGTSPIARQCAGPLQAIKRRLRERSTPSPGRKAETVVRKVWEYRTSVICHYTHERLVNMKATSVRYRRSEGGFVPQKRQRIHKVLHRRTGEGSVSCHGGTWNRDSNAARNILMLLMLEVRGMVRPPVFCKQLAERRRGDPTEARA